MVTQFTLNVSGGRSPGDLTREAPATSRNTLVTSQETRIRAVGARAMPSFPAHSSIPSHPSITLEPAPPGALFFEDELNLPARFASFREPEPSYNHPSPSLGLAISGLLSPPANSTVARSSPSPDHSRGSAAVDSHSSPLIKYDENSYYNALGFQKFIEDLATAKKGRIQFEGAYLYLKSILLTPGDFELEQYLRVNQHLVESSVPKFREDKGFTFCLVPEHFTLQSVPNRVAEPVKMPIEILLKIETEIVASNVKVLTGKSGRKFCLYRIEHDTKELPKKLGEYIEDFNKEIVRVYATLKGNQGLLLDAIVKLFMRLEQLSPVQLPRRTNLAVLNYLLAKHNFPCVIFEKQYMSDEVPISVVDYMSFSHLWYQVIEGMKCWCKNAKIPYPFADSNQKYSDS